MPWLCNSYYCCCHPTGVCAQLKLETSGGGVRAPGDSVHFSCQGSGFRFGSYAVLWYRQALGGRLEWLSYISSGSYTVRYSPDVEGRATVSRVDSRSVSYLGSGLLLDSVGTSLHTTDDPVLSAMSPFTSLLLSYS
uniref:Ig-like domain-containing protein n=1 Tax=Gallus gallus TaxID=9031 RepID=A0A8V0ZY46_CHICK